MTDDLKSRIESVFYWRNKATDTSASFSRDAYYEVVDILQELTIRVAKRETKLAWCLKWIDKNVWELPEEMIRNKIKDTLSELNITQESI